VIAVIGDGAITGGMAYEAMNHAGFLDKNMIIILNDNQQVRAAPRTRVACGVHVGMGAPAPALGCWAAAQAGARLLAVLWQRAAQHSCTAPHAPALLPPSPPSGCACRCRCPRSTTARTRTPWAR